MTSPGTIRSEGLFSEADRLSELVATSPTFQEVVGARNLDEAMLRAHPFGADESEDPWPRAIILLDGYIATNSGTATWSHNGECELIFEFEIPLGANAVTTADEGKWFMNKVGAILLEMEALKEKDSAVWDRNKKLNMFSWEKAAGPVKFLVSENAPPDPASGLYLLPRWGVSFLVRWQ